MAKKKKLLASVAAVATAAAVLLGGTFAWQSISQTALNEASDVINPGGRLHDDFNGENKDIYVENFADDPIYARIQLSEYFEIIANYQFLQDEDETNDDFAVSTVLLGGEETDEDGNPVRTYTLFKNYASLVDGTLKAGVNGDYVDGVAEGETGYSYWSWKTGGSTVYMPTFNMNKDSLSADINGIYEEGNVGTISDRILDMTADNAQYSAYKEYTDGEALTGDEIYDADANDVEDDGITTVSGIEHIAKSTESGSLISMDEWLGMVEYDEDGNVTNAPGGYWVYDEDGWVYWSAPIEPDTATGLLLDGIELNQVMDDTWYYAINVVAQFVTADDVGKADGTGFYADGQAPTKEAENLLRAIGVTSVDDEAGEEGGSDDDEGDDDYTDASFNIEYADMNEDDTIYVSAADFATDGAGVQFTSFLGDTGEYAYAVDAEWQLEATDGNSYLYSETETDTSVFTVNVNKEASELTDNDEFKFAVTVTNATFPGESFTVNMTVIIGEAPEKITDSVSLQEAMNNGGVINIGGTIETDSDDDKELQGFNGATVDYMWTAGGTMTGGALNSTSGSSHTLFINNEDNWPTGVDEPTNAATINGTDITSGSRFAIYAQAVDAPITLNAMTITNNYGGGILAEYTKTITLNDLTVYAASLDDDYAWVNSALAAGMGANVEINGGSYTGTNAVYLLSSGANVTINGGTFVGNLTVEAGTLTIKGGTFTVDPSDYVADGYEAVDNGDGTWTVQTISGDESNISITTDDGTLDSLTDNVTLQLNNYEGNVTWSTSSEDVTVAGGENGAATVAFKTFAAPNAPSAYEYTITAADAEGNDIATYAVKYAPTTYTAMQIEYNANNGNNRSSEVSDNVTLGVSRYSGAFYIEETAQVAWTLTSEDGNSEYTGSGSINYDDFEAGTYTATAVCTCPDGGTTTVSFTVTVEGGGLDM